MKTLRATVLALAVAAGIAGCQQVQTTSGGAVGVERTQYMMGGISSEELDQAYAQSYRQTVSKAAAAGQLDRSSSKARRVQTVVRRLVAQTMAFRPDARGWKWETALIRNDELNANVGPGGKIIVYTGLIDRLQLTDDELAAVLGHEIAHALREHSREAMSRAYAAEIAKQGAVALLGLGEMASSAADVAVQYGMTLPNSRSNEGEADLIGLELAARAGYNPNAAISLWNKMQAASAGAPPEFLSTHPSSDTRISSLQQAIPKVMPLYLQTKGQR